MTFIRGPVCRGQMAVNVINDHFWVMFKDPDHDISVVKPEFLKEQYSNLEMPIETTSQNIFKTFSDEYREKDKKFIKAKISSYKEFYPSGQDINNIWKGNRAEDAPILTIYRHFDNASVHRGVVGELPRTMWVIDYSLLERIYYVLVAGYDVFGNVSHQSNIRRYTDFLRFEAELDFLTYMPVEDRMKILQSWYINTDMVQENIKLFNEESQIIYKTTYSQNEFIERIVNEHILKSTNIKFDNLNYVGFNKTKPNMPKEFKTLKDIQDGFKSLTTPGTPFIKYANFGDVNNMLIRIKMPDGNDFVLSMVVNRWHDNVNSQFREKDTLNPDLDTLDFIPYSVGSYPNSLIVVEYNDLPDFFDLIKNFKYEDKYRKKYEKYFTPRSHKNFWERFDWFQEHFNKSNPVESGLYDLNRYYHK
jgi:hypothetical protein